MNTCLIWDAEKAPETMKELTIEEIAKQVHLHLLWQFIEYSLVHIIFEALVLVHLPFVFEVDLDFPFQFQIN